MINIIPASKKDLTALNSLAMASKASWGYPKHYLETWRNQIHVQERLIKAKRVFKALDEQNKLVGFFGLDGSPPTLILEGFWVEPEAMGKGIGRALFQEMLKSTRALGAKKVEWESDPNAYPFYLHMGAAKVGEKEYVLEGQKRVLPVLEVLAN